MTWLTRRQRDGGVDDIPLPPIVSGRLWLCGKHAIGPDHRSLIEEVGGDALVVCLTERHELIDRYPEYVGWLDDPENGAVWLPVPDLHAPSLTEMASLAGRVVGALSDGETVVVHCAAGRGRAGTTAVCVLMALGVGRRDALATVAAARPGAGPEVGAQQDLVEALEDQLKGGRPR